MVSIYWAESGKVYSVKDKYSCILGVIILLCNNPVTLLIQIRGGIEDNSKIFFLISQ